MTALDFIVLSLAAGALVHVWFRGSIFTELRAYTEIRTELPPDDELLNDMPAPAESDDRASVPLWMRLGDRVLPTFVCELLVCHFCLSHHTPYILALLFFLPSLFVTAPWAVFLFKLPVYSLAATRLGNILNAIVPSTVKYNDE